MVILYCEGLYCVSLLIMYCFCIAYIYIDSI